MDSIELLKILDSVKVLGDKIELVEKFIKNFNKPASYRSGEIDKLAEALAKAQSEMDVASKSSANPFFKSRYADIKEIVAASRPALSKNGLSVCQNIVSYDDGSTILHTLLLHASGQYIESRTRMTPAKADAQSLGSYITYMKRYAYAAITGCVAGDVDDDANEDTKEINESMMKGTSLKVDHSRNTFETISKDQLSELLYELEGYPSFLETILRRREIKEIADLPKKDYRDVRDQIMKAKLAYINSKQIEHK